MDTFPRSCCDPGDAVDLDQVDLDSLLQFFSFCVSSIVFIVERTFGGDNFANPSTSSSRSCSSSSSSSSQHSDIMEEEFVDHLRLPASTRVGVDLKDPHLWKTISMIVLNPLIWNIVARIEYRTKIFTRLCLGRRKVACFFLAVLILVLGFWRNHLFNLTCHTQPSWIILRQNRVLILGYLSCVIGTVLVVTSFYQLGFFATFLGDYFGIFTHSEMVSSFPFSIVDDPMYLGSFLNFLGVALVKSSPSGILLAFLVGAVYKIALLFETPFVTLVYQEKRTKEIEEAMDDEDDFDEKEVEEEELESSSNVRRVRKKEE